MILLDALYINNSGGKVLLDYLIETLHSSNLKVFYLLDDRIEGDYPFLPKEFSKYQKASLIRRHLFYYRNRNRFSHILCFGNIPPTIKLSAKVVTYLHQFLYLTIPKDLELKKKWLLFLKSSFVRLNKKNTNLWAVQSENVAKTLSRNWKIPEESVLQIPFFPTLSKEEQNTEQIKNSFVYVSDGNPHKNHFRLLTALKKTFSKYQDISLHLTISKRYPNLINEIKFAKEKGIKVFNHGLVPKTEIGKLYAQSEYLIYPSLSESFGLGIVEGISMGCKVIGADLPYLHAACSPSLVFDPLNVNSIAEAIEQTQTQEIPLSKSYLTDQVDELIELLHD